MSTEIVPFAADPQLVRRQADTHAQLIALWLHGRSGHTQRAYRADIQRFLGHVQKPLHLIGLADLQGFADALDTQELEPASRHRILSAVKSLFAFGHRLGYLPFDTARPLRLPALRDKLSERILTEAEVQRMLALECQPRNHALLMLLYASAVRVSECCRLRWRDLQERTEGGQVTVFGKGGKTNVVLLPVSVWSAVMAIRDGVSDDAPVFRSRKRGHLDPSQVLRIVRKAARRAGIVKAVSPHFLRHSHASHALDRGAAISLVQVTLNHSSVATTGRYLHARPSDSSSRYLPL